MPLRSVTTLADRLGGWPEVILTGSAVAALAWVIGGVLAGAALARRRRTTAE